MTVCIAAISYNSVLGAADRMLTSGNIQYEPAIPKIYDLTSSVAIMFAGDAFLYSEILQGVKSLITNDSTFTVEEVSDIYIQVYNSVRFKKLENEILAPYGFTLSSFIEKQKAPSSEDAGLLVALQNHIVNFKPSEEGVDVLIAGLDKTGAHIYRIIENSKECCDNPGFASIGAGYRHAESQFMLARYKPFTYFQETLLLTYLAKKKSEVAPFVGKEATDMYMIYFSNKPEENGKAIFTFINSLNMKAIEEIYERFSKRENDNFGIAKNEIFEHVDQISHGKNEEKSKENT